MEPLGCYAGGPAIKVKMVFNFLLKNKPKMIARESMNVVIFGDSNVGKTYYQNKLEGSSKRFPKYNQICTTHRCTLGEHSMEFTIVGKGFGFEDITDDLMRNIDYVIILGHEKLGDNIEYFNKYINKIQACSKLIYYTSIVNAISEDYTNDNFVTMKGDINIYFPFYAIMDYHFRLGWKPIDAKFDDIEFYQLDMNNQKISECPV